MYKSLQSMRGMLSSMFGRHHQIDNIDNKDNKDAMEEYLNEDAFTDTVDDLILRARDAINRFIKTPLLTIKVALRKS